MRSYLVANWKFDSLTSFFVILYTVFPFLQVKGKDVNLFQPASEFLPMISEVSDSVPLHKKIISRIILFSENEKYFLLKTIIVNKWIHFSKKLILKNTLELHCTPDPDKFGLVLMNNCVIYHHLHYFQVFQKLVDVTKDIKGAKVEDHKFCASVHYRNVDENVSNILLMPCPARL